MPELPGRSRWEAELRRAFQLVGQANAERMMEWMGNPPNPANIPMSFWNALGNGWRDRFEPILMNVYLESAREMVAVSPIEINWTAANENAAKWARSYSFRLVRQINTTTEQRLQTIFDDFFTEKGKTVGDLRRLIEPEVQDLTVRLQDGTLRMLTAKERAKLIATTEVTRASVEGETGIIQQIKAAGIEMVAIWETQMDQKVCPICRPRQGHERGNGWTEPPPAHPGCFCNLRYEPKVRER
jgi:hypothetical protein